MKATILVIDDEKIQRHMVEGFLRKAGYEVFTAAGGQEGVTTVKERSIDIVITDFKMPGMGGLEVLESVKQINPQIAVLMVTAFGTVQTAVEAMKKGAADFITKPVNLEALSLALDKIVEKRQLVRENAILRRRLKAYEREPQIVGQNPALAQCLETARRVAASDTTVLVTGETGTGKELVASLIHRLSPRADGPLLKINCGAIPRELIESELFGHMQGAFTGAVRDKVGVLVEADAGTLFLDEVGELPLEAQVKLLNVLQDRAVVPVGATRPQKTDIRIVAATNRDLKAQIKAGQFREDLYFRLNVVPIHLPPLRERKTDIPLLVAHFTREVAARLRREVPAFSAKAQDLLVKYAWPGNVRELANVVERVLVLTEARVIEAADLPLEVKFEPIADETKPLADFLDLNGEIERLEKLYIEKALDFYKRNQTLAAQALGLSERVIRYKIKKYGLKD